MTVKAPCQRLVPVRTRHESKTHEEFAEGIIVEIPAKLTSQALSIFKPLIPEDLETAFQHLRRIVTLQRLPQDLLERRGCVKNGVQTVFYLIPSKAISHERIGAILRPYIQPGTGLPRYILAVVPVNAPLSSEQAKLWSERYWPCIYNPASQVLQDAPPLHQSRRVRTELDTDFAAKYIRLALLCGQEAVDVGHGKGVGAVVVDPTTKVVLAAAGDARWWGGSELISAEEAHKGGGRPEHHALMRVIAMVANKELRRRLRAGLHKKFASTSHESSTGQPLTPLEVEYASGPTKSLSEQDEQDESVEDEALTAGHADLPPAQREPRKDGYLCNGLDIYLTHEPCVCCAMAMVHSRFRACILINRVPATGALGASVNQGGLCYGLFWRRELNWRVMTFQYDLGNIDGILTQEVAETFHA